MKKLVTILLVLTMSVTACAWLVDWSDADSREDAQHRLKKIDQLFKRQTDIREFIEALNDHRGFAIGVFGGVYEDRFDPRLILSKDWWSQPEGDAAERFLDELLEITQSKLDSLMETK